jgi:hypothetical protein
MPFSKLEFRIPGPDANQTLSYSYEWMVADFSRAIAGEFSQALVTQNVHNFPQTGV